MSLTSWPEEQIFIDSKFWLKQSLSQEETEEISEEAID